MIGASSGTYNFQPVVAELVRVAYSRIQVFPPQLTTQHIIDARMAANLILSDWGAVRGVNLAQVELITIPLLPLVPTYTLPTPTIDLLDVYLRTVTPNTTTYNIGHTLTPLGPQGNPFVTQPYGDPLLIAPASGTLSCTAGSEVITLNWPAHGLAVGDPIFWGCPVSIGAVSIVVMSFVTNVVDSNNVQFLTSTPARETQTGQGGTRLFSTAASSTTVSVIFPGHGLSVGDPIVNVLETTVGGITIEGSDYTVLAVNNSYEFTFTAASAATGAASVFENGGQLNVTSQLPTVQYTDVPLFPLSRTDYASLSYKLTPGRPTSYWLDRVVPPSFTLYPIPPAPTENNPTNIPNLENPGATSNQLYGFFAYVMREFQDANPVNGQTPDMPRRMWSAFTAALTAAVAEIYRPEAWAEKTAAAEAAWQRAAAADTERVTWHLTPNFGAYYR